MKKLALILLIGIYSSAVFGAGAGPFICCDNNVFTAFIFPGNATATSDDCGSMHHGAVVTNHHIAAAAIHFSSRNYYNIQPHTGFAGFASSAVIQKPLISACKSNNAIVHTAVPVYILHCVYRL